jgi:hypothetical protein
MQLAEPSRGAESITSTTAALAGPAASQTLLPQTGWRKSGLISSG